MRIALLAPLVFSACAPDVEAACAEYFDAHDDCAVEYADALDLDPDTVRPAVTTCDAYADLHDKDAAALLDCYRDVWRAADCTTDAGWSEAEDAAAGCFRVGRE